MFEPGDQIDIWVIEQRLGAGGMGSVYRCHNKDANRILAAIKVLEAHVSAHPEARRRFIREAEILFSLEHPNIVRVRNVRVDHATPYIEMEFVRGQSIEDRLGRGGPFTLLEALPLFGQIASALAYLHTRGVRHRDIKPANLLLTQTGMVKLVDFGLAMEADSTRLTQGNMSFGTVSYAPPEWVDPDSLDPVLWDLYACGVVFWEMLTGHVAFPVSGEGSARQQAFQVVMKKQGHEPLDPGDDFPEDVRAIIRDLTRSDPKQRLASGAELMDRLRRVAGVGHMPPTPSPPRPRTQETLVPREGTGLTFQLDPSAETAILPQEPDTAETEPPAGTPVGAVLTADIADDDEDDDAVAGGSGRGGLIAVGVAVVVLLLALVGGGVAVAMLSGDTGTRDVTLTVEGLGDGIDANLALDGAYPSDQEGRAITFSTVSAGTHEVQWAVGQDCEALACKAGRCSDHCLHGWREIDIPAGEGAFELPFKLAAPAPRPVRVGLSGIDKKWPVAIAVEGAEGGMEGPVWKGASLSPGVYRARVLLGECPDEGAAPCEDDCPPGCRDAVRELLVPVGQGRPAPTLVVAAPEPVAAGSTPKGPAGDGGSQGGSSDRGSQGTDGGSRGTDGGSQGTAGGSQGTAVPPKDGGSAPPKPLVTNAQYARWLESHPQWKPEAAKASGLADEFYLDQWNGDQPAAGTENGPVLYIPHLAARTYCQGRGGLPQISDAPTTWADDGSRIFELRFDGDQAAVIEYSGSVTRVGPSQALMMTGFRCAR